MYFSISNLILLKYQFSPNIQKNRSDNMKLIPSLILFLTATISVNSAWVVQTCADCISLQCPSGKCYNLSGSGYPTQAKQSMYQICSEQDCSNESPFGRFAISCKYDTNLTQCNSGCCVKERHGSLVDMCTDQFPAGEKFCNADLSMEQIIGVIFGALGGVCIITVIVACFWKKCLECCAERNQQGNDPRKRKYVKQPTQDDNRSSKSAVSSKSKASEINLKGKNKNKKQKDTPKQDEAIASIQRLKNPDQE